MKLPTAQDWMISAKTFGAAVLALGVGLSAGLERPYWAMATVYIASQPLSGTTRSKAIFRLSGTLLGAAAAVVLVPNLASSPEILSVALAAWAATCLTISLLDRTPRSYVFMLAGYTAAIIGFPSVAAPDLIWDTAVARVEEIGLGIVCASLVASLIFPRHVGPVVAQRTEAWLRDGRLWALAVLDGQETPERALQDCRRLAADAVELGAITGHLAYDPSLEQQATRAIRALHGRMLLLLPLLSSVSDRLGALRGAGGLNPALLILVASIADWLRAGGAEEGEAALRQAIVREDALLEAAVDWHAIMQAGLLLRLREFLDLRRTCLRLQAHILARRSGLPPLLDAAETMVEVTPHRDFGMALFSGASAGLAICLVCLFWISSGWPEGFIAAEMTAVACCFFAARDNPVPAIVGFLTWTVVAVLVDAVYLFGILPVVNGFEVLVVVLAPAFLLFGLLIARPSTAPAGLALAANSATLLSLQDTYSADFAAYMNTALATVTGMAVAALVTQLVRSMGAETSFRRMARANWRDLSRAAERRGQGDQAVFAALFLDRLGLAAPRLSVIPAGSALQASDFLGELRIGLNILDLRRARHLLPKLVVHQVDTVLDGLAHLFRVRATATQADGANATQLLTEIDLAIAAAAGCLQTDGRRQALLGLVGIRRVLFPQSPSYATPPVSARRLTVAAA